MPDRITGHYVPGALAGSRYQAFIPDPLPPEPPLDFAVADLVARKSAPIRRWAGWTASP